MMRVACLLSLSTLFACATVSTPPEVATPEPAVSTLPTGAQPAPVEWVDLTVCARGDGQLLQRAALGVGQGDIYGLAAGPEGTVAVLGADDRVTLWQPRLEPPLEGEVGDEQPVFYGLGELDIPHGAPHSGALSFDSTGELLTAGHVDGRVNVYATAERWAIAGFDLGPSTVRSVTHNVTGSLLAAATASAGGGLQIWSLGGPPSDPPLESALAWIDDLAFGSTGDLLISSGAVVSEDPFGLVEVIPALEVRSASAPHEIQSVIEVRALAGTHGFTSVTPIGEGRLLAAGSVGLAVVDLFEPSAPPLATWSDGEVLIATLLDADHFMAATSDGWVWVGRLDDLSVGASLEVPAFGGGDVLDPQRLFAADADVLRWIGCAG
jgi:hypothetical protein